MQKYVILIDVDGTLVSSGGQTLDNDTVESFKKLKANGHIIVISTGRSLHSIQLLKGIENASFYAGMLGEQIFDCDENIVIKNPKTMDSQIVEKFINEVENKHLHWTYKDDFAEKTYYEDLLGIHSAIKCTREDYLEDLKNNKISQILINETLPNDIIEKFPMYNYYFMPRNYVDVIINGVSKANVVKFFREKYPNHKIVAIGDSDNDMDMFELSDISIAMGNAKKSIQEACTYTTKSVEEKGVLYALENILNL